MNHNHTERRTMNHTNHPTPLVAIGLALVAFVAACGGTSGPLGTLPPGSSAPEPSVVQGSPDVTPGPSDLPTTDPTGSALPTADPSTDPSAGPVGTTIVRAYLWLGSQPGSEGLVAVLREVPATKSVATAAISLRENRPRLSSGDEVDVVDASGAIAAERTVVVQTDGETITLVGNQRKQRIWIK